jgi:hypothetical protein
MYIPKNKITTDLYTNGEEYIRVDNFTLYRGPYWINHKGVYFTGKTPQDGPNVRLEPNTPFFRNGTLFNNSDFESISPLNNYSISQIALIDGGYDNSLLDGSLIANYTNLNPPNTTNFKVPILQYPQPTESDYNIGTFTRYFLVKVNENVYLEVKKETYDFIQNKDIEWVWYLYQPFTVDWVITGIKEEVYKTNKNTVLIIENRIKRKGLQNFLKENYLKFFK